MTDDQDIQGITDALIAALPAEFHPDIPVLVQVLIAAHDGSSATVTTKNLQNGLIALRRQTVTVNSGNITVHDVSGEGIAIGHGAKATVVRIYLPRTRTEISAWRDRNCVVDRVRTSWIESLLLPSLHQGALIDLTMQDYPDALEKRLPQSRIFVSLGTTIAEVFDRSYGELLILGSPGTGKTTMLLELARTLIIRAQQDETKAIPIVFNLASWAEKRLPLANWLVETLHQDYKIKTKIAWTWIAESQILPLLDGLDEVRPGYRGECIEAINTFSKEYGPVNLVVCSRIADYEEVPQKLQLARAVLLHPLTEPQMKTAFQQLGDTGEKVGMVLRQLQDSAVHAKDLAAQNLACTPLLLSIATLAYQGNTESKLPPPDASPSEQQHHLFATYVDHMLERWSTSQKYTPEQTRYWLAWLAGRMQQYDVSIFNFRNVQPWWLKKRWQRIIFYISMAIIFSLIGGIIGGITFGLSGIAIGSLSLGLTFGLFRELNRQRFLSVDGDDSSEALPWLTKFFYQLRSLVGRGLLFGSITGLSGGLMTGLVSRMFLSFPYLVWHTCLGSLVGLMLGTYFGIGFTFILGLVDDNRGKRVFVPGEKWWLVISAAILGIAFGLLTGLWFPSLSGAVGGGFSGLFGGIAGTLSNGRRTPIRQAILWSILCRTGYIHWNYTDFLDYATERIFLRKVANGYIFVHKELEKYFASLEQEHTELKK